MPTSTEVAPGRGGHPRVTAALGLVLALVALTLPWSVPRVAGWVSGSAPAASGPATDARLLALPPFLVEPGVVIGHARPHRAAAAGRPVRLVVPALHVDAPVVPIGAPGGVLLPPSDPLMLGWWDRGAVPGAAYGGALITGHTVHTGGGAFDDLETLRRGDRVEVRTVAGTLRYAVTGVTIYRKASLARDAQRVFSQSVPGRLVLITCEDWNGSVYLSNAVVFAEQV
ncbi:MAG: class F sortase [Nocardioides sp.]